MKKLITLLLISFFTTVCGQVDANEYEKIFTSENVLIDVRTPAEFDAGHLNKAVNIPYDKIAADIEKVAPDKNQAIVVYCRSGRRADIAAKQLQSMGYTNVINAGRYTDLKELEEKFNTSKQGK